VHAKALWNLAEEANSLAADIGGWHDLKGCLIE
jgi:hypothetical protein